MRDVRSQRLRACFARQKWPHSLPALPEPLGDAKRPPIAQKRRPPKGSYIRDLIFPERIGIVVKCGYAVFSSFPGMSIAPMQL